MQLRDFREFLPTGASGDPDELELVGKRIDHAQGVITDRAGRAEEDDAFAGLCRRCGHEDGELAGANLFSASVCLGCDQLM